ncbi:CPBP family intramembrane metalloprotease [Halomicroarcula sp. F13]|uniref:CPBP family intramembrane metalloprotease n=1 Tax=Haloarcula rubra TaxID=2487747 RepID=A0AAW4Q029_9EURY|nr:CPBP family intramembrane glutamic endopeptidase [Halomicroarcula rubra]MBX0325857.1 CPBP family intramembrane metalloprotease [Halomicroarcula rubra]
MRRATADLPTLKGGAWMPLGIYLTVIAVLSALLIVFPGDSPPPILGMAWGVFLVVLVVGAFSIEGITPRSLFPSVRTLFPVILVLGAFWGLYNLVAFSLALGGVAGFEATWSRVAAHPVLYLGALLSSLLFTAIPEELVFRSYLQQKCIAIAGGKTRRAIAAGIVVAAVLFAGFHLPRWFLASGHGLSPALGGRLFGLTLMGLTYGIVYAISRNLWLVALIHATMNYPPVLVTMSVPPELHLVVGVIETAAIVSVVSLFVRATEPDGINAWRQREPAS